MLLSYKPVHLQAQQRLQEEGCVVGISHITQQPGESARKFWTRSLTKKNQTINCPDVEALATLKHNIRDEWLARHLGQEKLKSMAALTTLMTRFCAGEDSWLARSRNTASEAGTSEVKKATASSDTTRTNVETIVITLMTLQSTLDSVAPSPIGGRSHTKETIRDHPAWTAYSIVHARSMAPQKNRPTIPTEIVGFLNRPAS